MKVKQDRKQKPVLKVKKETKNSESSLNKAVKNVKQILKKKVAPTETKKVEEKKIEKVEEKKTKNVEEKKTKNVEEKKTKDVEEKRPFRSVNKSKSIIKIKGMKAKKPRTFKKSYVKDLKRGLVYIGHIPHGFYEEQMKEYFSQFGRVTRVRLVRSARTGKSRGYGYVEFAMPDVAVIAAESMNNYLMNGRLVKTTYIAPEDQHKKYFKGPKWSETTYPRLTNRTNYINKYNAPISEEQHELQVEKTLKNFSDLSKKLKEEGIDLDFKVSQTTS